MTKSWSAAEVEVTVEDYFHMLRLELLGESFNKAQHNRELLERLNNRSKGAVEKKHQNISAVLIEMGVPWISGYKPLSNYQNLLIEAVSNYLQKNQDIQSIFMANSDAIPKMPTVGDILKVLEDPPSKSDRRAGKVKEPEFIYNPNEINFLEREARNQRLGDAGEEFVLNYERARLIYAGKENLAEKVEQVSQTIGPSAGFDIHSYEHTGHDRLIEAKTTKYGKETPFYITPNELKCSWENTDRYFIYRVFKFEISPAIYTLNGQVENLCHLEPSLYLARPK